MQATFFVNVISCQDVYVSSLLNCEINNCSLVDLVFLTILPASQKGFFNSTGFVHTIDMYPDVCEL